MPPWKLRTQANRAAALPWWPPKCVRWLSAAGAAREIKALIADSVGHVATGSRLVDQAGATMSDVVTSVARVTDVMTEIVAASQEQSQGIDQINEAVAQMDQVTQQNAALVEEAAAAAGAMQEQAATLSELVAVFNIAPGAAHTAPAPAIARGAGRAAPGDGPAASQAPRLR